MPGINATSVEAVFESAILEEFEDEALEASEYGNVIDDMMDLSPLDPKMLDIRDGMEDGMIDAILNDDEITDMLDDEIAEDDLDNEEDED